MILVESPLTAELELTPLFLELGHFRIDIVPFVISFLKGLQKGMLREDSQFNAFMVNMIDILNEVLEEGAKGRSMTPKEEMRLRMSVTLRIYQVLCGGNPPAES